MDEIEQHPSTSGVEVRHRVPGLDSISDAKDLIEFPEIEDSVDTDSDDCPLPSTPEHDSLMDPKEHEYNRAEELLHYMWDHYQDWRVHPFSKLPSWLQDNDYLHDWHRPPLPSFSACFHSIFRIHTETGNIWTHLLGFIVFLGLSVYVAVSPDTSWEKAMVFLAFLVAAVICLGLSTMFHTLSCHSEFVGKLFCKFDYCGIAVLIMGSFVPWLYYGFYCDRKPKLIYMVAVLLLGVSTIIVSLWDKFSTPRYRPLRTSVFLVFGLSGIVPAVHYSMVEGVEKASSRAALGPLALMGALYVAGAVLYALRVPERWFPGKCDLAFHSHQIFHTLVVLAAFVHYHGISSMAMYREAHGECLERDDVLGTSTVSSPFHI